MSYYQARYYDATLNRFIQPDSIIPDLYNPQYLNRYSYVRNNPVRYTDPTGHAEECVDNACGTGTWTPPPANDDDSCRSDAPNCGLAKKFYNVSTALDQYAFQLDVVGEGISFGGTLVGMVTCSETGAIGIAGCGVGGYLVGNSYAQATTNFASNITSLASTGFTILGDALAGETRITGNNLVIGQNTASSILTTGIGFWPDTTVDVIASGAQYFVNDRQDIPRSLIPGPLQIFFPQGPIVIPLPRFGW